MLKKDEFKRDSYIEEIDFLIREAEEEIKKGNVTEVDDNFFNELDEILKS